MNTIEQTYHDEIEVENIQAAAEQGSFMFFSSFGFSIVIVFVLLDYVSHSLILLWFFALNIINLIRWLSLRAYKTRVSTLNSGSVLRMKVILLIGAVIGGLCWGVANLLFIDPAEPFTLLIMSVAIFLVCMGAILSWFSYLPAVIAYIITAGGFLIVPLLLQGHKDSVGLGIVLIATALSGISGCFKVGRIYNSALHLNFENVELHRESQEKSLLLETALENMGQGISMSDKDDQLRMWNRQFIDLLGSSGDKVKSNINLKSILKAADPPLNIKPGRGAEYCLEDGRVFEIRQSELQHGGRVVTYTNISDLIKRERALEEARKLAEQANVAKTRFLAAASHDLRQPIHALGLFFAELSDRVHSPETESLITQIDDSITAINSMLNALLDVSKLDAGVVKPNIVSFKLTDLFIRLESEFTSIALENHNQLHIRRTEMTVRSDPAMVELMLRNLISNALRYTENGCVLVAARPRGKNVEIQVVDNGPGIPEDQLDEVFIEFHQVGNPARDRRQGLGLGLAIVKRQASLLKHELNLVSNLGRGCCFSIKLPMVHVVQAEPKSKVREHFTASPLDECSVLVLDDDHDVLEGMRGLLTRWGCQVTTASTSTEAFGQIDVDQNKPDLLIVDYRLTDNVSGIEVAKELQNSKAVPVPVLIITGDTGPERLREADASGYPLLHKPVQPAKLRSTIQYLLGKHIHNHYCPVKQIVSPIARIA